MYTLLAIIHICISYLSYEIHICICIIASCVHICVCVHIKDIRNTYTCIVANSVFMCICTYGRYMKYADVYHKIYMLLYIVHTSSQIYEVHICICIVANRHHLSSYH